MAKATRRNFHVPLTDSLYDELRVEALRLGRPATDVAREAIERHLHDRRREAVDRAVMAFARKHAGSAVDLDEELELAAARKLFSRDAER